MTGASRDSWAAVDSYLIDRLISSDPARQANDAAQAAGLPRHEVSPPQGKLLYLLARMIGARTILELGTLGGYSTVWLARALPAGGKLATLEADHDFAEGARANIARARAGGGGGLPRGPAGVGGVVDLHIGPALDTLRHLGGPFDLIFIDADKRSNPEYLEWSLTLA